MNQFTAERSISTPPTAHVLVLGHNSQEPATLHRQKVAGRPAVNGKLQVGKKHLGRTGPLTMDGEGCLGLAIRKVDLETKGPGDTPQKDRSRAQAGQQIIRRVAYEE